MGLKEEHFLGSEGKTFQEQIYEASKSLLNPTIRTKFRYRFFLDLCVDIWKANT